MNRLPVNLETVTKEVFLQLSDSAQRRVIEEHERQAQRQKALVLARKNPSWESDQEKVLRALKRIRRLVSRYPQLGIAQQLEIVAGSLVDQIQNGS